MPLLSPFWESNKKVVHPPPPVLFVLFSLSLHNHDHSTNHPQESRVFITLVMVIFPVVCAASAALMVFSIGQAGEALNIIYVVFFLLFLCFARAIFGSSHVYIFFAYPFFLGTSMVSAFSLRGVDTEDSRVPWIKIGLQVFPGVRHL